MAKRTTAGKRKTRGSSKRVTPFASKRAASTRSARKGPGAAGKSAPKRGASTSAARRKTAARAAAARSRSPRPPEPSRLSAAATFVTGAAKSALAAVAERLPWAKDENDPIALLETDHRRFEDLMKAGEETTSRAVKRRTDVLRMITSELNVHELIEEKILYPALRPHAETRHIVLEGYEEHHVADILVKELRTLAKNDEKWGAKFKVLKESLEHHIEEEENNMFPAARAVLSREELDDLGVRMKALRAEVGG